MLQVDTLNVCDMPVSMDVNGMRTHVQMPHEMVRWNVCNMLTNMDATGTRPHVLVLRDVNHWNV
jgi:hypothetical protein